MKKRTITIIAVLAAISMLSFAVFAGNDTYAGYERFKDLLRNDQEFESGQGQGKLTVIDNGEEILSLSGNFVGDKTSEEGFGNLNIQAGDLNKSLELYGQDEKMYIVDGDDVYITSHDESLEERDYHHKYDQTEYDGKEFDAKSEAIMDILMADFKDDFSLEGNNVVFELNKEEIPALVNLMASSDYEKETYHDDMSEEMMAYPLFEELSSLENLVPELTETEIEYIKFVLLVEDDVVNGFEMNVIVKGLDQAGESHQVEVQGHFTKSSESVEMKTFELTDQTVYELKENR
ncbi:hypothetical protein EZV73_16790 [Acidaminobacter sp. JC074]|uniref:hypothetical protein n=1 Tax=Acidaminobacter sp. JC074 TaxID=2530199 RepID=UPI001F10B74F|nr:hypothetical protein [Acidaminobacter sp. JC074]MCH4889256.1 hypothetical protein [Acidaminobacter sp. JC074]